MSTGTAGGCATVSPTAEPKWLHNKTVHSAPTLGKKKDVADWKKQPHENHTTL